MAPGEVSVDVFIEFPEEVSHPGLLIVVVLEEPLSPLVPVEVLNSLKLLQVVQLVLEPAVALPGHHPHVAPFIPQGLGARILDALLVVTHACAANDEV